jgi:SAM-dependent methyltransferase
MRDVLAQVLPPDPATIVVDVGCGPGANIAALADRYSCIGIDTAPEAIAHAQERFHDVRYVCGQAPQDLGEVANQVSAFMLMDVLEHVPDDREMLARMVDVLRPGGYVFITVPADMRLWSEQDERLGHYRRYDPALLRGIWAGMPVSEVMLSHFNSRLYPVVRMVRLGSRLTGRAWGRDGSDMRIPKGPGNRLLGGVLAGESRRLVELTRGERPAGYSTGVSLIALLRKTGSSGDAAL